jgi:hypothetical protein
MAELDAAILLMGEPVEVAERIECGIGFLAVLRNYLQEREAILTHEVERVRSQMDAWIGIAIVENQKLRPLEWVIFGNRGSIIGQGELFKNSVSNIIGCVSWAGVFTYVIGK